VITMKTYTILEVGELMMDASDRGYEQGYMEALERIASNEVE